MRIALDATPLLVPTGGVARYTAQLAAALAAAFPSDQIHLLSDQTFPRPSNALHRRWWLFGLPAQLSRLRIDVFHGTDFAVPYLPLRPSVLSLHDLSPWRDSFQHHASPRVRRRTPLLMKLGLATLILTPSEAIRREAIAHFRLPPNRIVSVPHAAAAFFQPVCEPPPPTPYFLYVGALEARKNLQMLLAVWRQLRQRHSVDLVLVGRPRPDFPAIPPQPGLHLRGPLPDSDLPALYSNCLACLYPSLYEGFGLPILEAMQCGAAVITSRDPALLETASDAALTLNASDPAAWLQALTAAVEQPDLIASLKRRSLARAADFSWPRTAHLTRAVYTEALARFHRA